MSDQPTVRQMVAKTERLIAEARDDARAAVVATRTLHVTQRPVRAGVRLLRQSRSEVSVSCDTDPTPPHGIERPEQRAWICPHCHGHFTVQPATVLAYGKEHRCINAIAHTEFVEYDPELHSMPKLLVAS